jgi:hypothetical protein
MNSLYVGLLHNPVLNRHGETVTTAVTNLDLHDLPRTCLTYGVKALFMVNPLSSQEQRYREMRAFWDGEQARMYHPDRAAALGLLQWSPTLSDAIETITNQEGNRPLIIATTARNWPGQLSYAELRQLRSTRGMFLLIGTGHGLTEDVLLQADAVPIPIRGFGEYNHLSVRSATAVILDRLSSEE